VSLSRSVFLSLLQVNESKARSARLGRLPPPDAQARRYRRALVGRMLPRALEIVRAELLPLLERAAESASRVATTDATDNIGEAIDRAERKFFEEWTRARMARLVRPIGEEIERLHSAGLNRQLRAVVGVDAVGGEPWLGRAVDEFTAENVALIRSIPTRFFDDLETNLKRELADGARFEELIGIVEERYGVSQSRATLIARDQSGKFYGDLNRVRQTDLGIERFTWRTARDNRVREEHEDRDGEVYTWSAPPEGETPGEPVNCRCYAEPDLKGLLPSGE